MERFGLPSHRGLSVRSILTFVLVVVVTALLWVLIGNQNAHAADPTAAWSGDSIVYDNHGYNKVDDFKDATNTIPAGATVYKTPTQAVEGSSSKKVFILYFSSGVDPPTATTVKYVEFTLTSSNATSNPQNKRDVTLTVKGQEDEASSCSVQGIGWIVCPVSVFIAEGMDNIFQDVLAPMIAVQPTVLGDQNNSMYVAWNVMRNIANVAFVIVFLIIIYSQLTNLGVSNYGLKKLIPRLIIAAVLVNVSFIVAAVAIDLSNILGYSIQDIFNIIRENLFKMTNDDVSGINASTQPWTAVTAVILAGGGAIGGVFYLATGGLWLLIPLLLGLISVLILVVVVLAARQAIIVILVIIAPIAFVANLLPNTEKWFDKWKDLFFTMLIFFPAFSLVFGGSQLAGQLIIQNAGDNVVMLLFGLAVQIAPLVITPLLLKFSGSLLGRIAQIANNPSKGLLDRNKNWAQARADNTRARNWAGEGRKFNPTTWGAGMVRRVDGRKKNLADQTAAYKARGDVKFEDRDKKYNKINKYNALTGLDKEKVHNHHEEEIEDLKRNQSSAFYGRALKAEASKETLETAKNRTSQHFNQQRLNGGALNASTIGLEASKATLETSDNLKNQYLNSQRMMGTGALYSTVAPLEASKLQLAGSQDRYTAMVDKMKLDVSSPLYGAAQQAQASKERLEIAQGNVQTLFDRRRQVQGSELNDTAIQMVQSKALADEAKTDFEAYIATQKVDNADLRVPILGAERAKLSQQKADARLTALTESFKTGKIERSTLSTEELVIMDQMKADSIELSAQKQAGVSAQYEIQRNFAEVMTGSGPLTDAMLNIAQGVGGDTARLRAQSQAVKASKSLDNDALNANVELLKSSAQRAGDNLKGYSAGVMEAVLKGEPMYKGEYITPEMTKAAFHAQMLEKNVPLLERVRGNPDIDQAMVSEVVDLNAGPLKGAGAFGLVDNPRLNINNYDSNEEFDQALNIQRVSNLANANSSGLGNLKFGWVANSLADPDNLKNNIQSVLREIQIGKDPDATKEQKKAGVAAEASLKAAFSTVRGALTNEDTLADMTDREQFLRTIDNELADIFGQERLSTAPLELKIDADAYAQRATPEQSDIAPDLGDAVEDGDDTITPRPE